MNWLWNWWPLCWRSTWQKSHDNYLSWRDAAEARGRQMNRQEAQAHTLTEELVKVRAEKATLAADVAAWKETLEEERKRAQQAIAELHKRKYEELEAHEVTREELRVVCGDLAASQRSANITKEEIERLKAAAAELKGQITKLYSQIDTLRAEKEVERADYRTAIAELAALRDRFMAERDEARAERAQANDRFSQLTADLYKLLEKA